jgi:hypothetical protein
MDLKLCAMSIATYLGDLQTPRDIAAESSTEHSVISHRWLYLVGRAHAGMRSGFNLRRNWIRRAAASDRLLKNQFLP